MAGPTTEGRKLHRSFGRLVLLGVLLVVGVGGRRVVSLVEDRIMPEEDEK